MNWFRRDLDDFSEKDWEFTESSLFRPILSVGFPEPWRRHCDRHRIYLFPLDFCKIFADKRQLNNISRKEEDYICSLRESIQREGLFNPAVMKYDNNGKLRYHDGYHRLAAVLEIDGFDFMPVKIEQSPRVKGYGRVLSEELLTILDVVDKDFNV